MEKQQFHTLLINYTSLTAEEAQLLVSLEKEFPYSQVIHSIAARGAQDNRLADHEDQLHLAAIYTTDRTVFKSIMTAKAVERKVSNLTLPAVESEKHVESIPVKPEEQQTVETKNITSFSNEKDISPVSTDDIQIDDSFYEEVKHDLERLKYLKHEFEETLKHFESDHSNEPNEATSDTSSEIKKSKISDPNDELLNEIKSSNKKIKPEDPKQKEQIEIINQFIKTQPTIKNKTLGEKTEIPQGDLAESSSSYSDNIISETLAQILIKQGKKEKAIEVLKKLIWKFPQKKAYFAAQIEELKK